MTAFIDNAKIKYGGHDYTVQQLKITYANGEGRLEFTLPGKIKESEDDVVVTFKPKPTKPKYLEGKKSTSFDINF